MFCLSPSQLNTLLDREDAVRQVQLFLREFETNHQHNHSLKRGLYICGPPSCGKTSFITHLLKESNYALVLYDACDARNKSTIDALSSQHMGHCNVLSMFRKNIKPIAVIMDEMDGMNNSDKCGLASLAKLIRPKKNKAQLHEDTTINPIVCIGNTQADKKLKEIMKLCHVVTLQSPTLAQCQAILLALAPTLDPRQATHLSQLAQGDLHQLFFSLRLFQRNPTLPRFSLALALFPNTENIDTQKNTEPPTPWPNHLTSQHIVQSLFRHDHPLCDHHRLINDSDRSIVGLLWHENVTDGLDKYPRHIGLPLYSRMLRNFCLADTLDRIMFQKQTWLFNELSSILKTFQNNHLLHQAPPCPAASKQWLKHTPLRFTKVLTKFATEHNVRSFLQELCQSLHMDCSDMFLFFYHASATHSHAELAAQLEPWNVSKLDIARFHRFFLKISTSTSSDNDDNDDP